MTTSEQREYLINFEKLCGIKKPIFLDTTDTWKIFDNDLVFANDLKTEHAIGRQRLSFRNSEVCEIWIDVDNHDSIAFKPYKEKRLAPAVQKLNSLGISNDFIFPKVSGTGVHLHIFVTNLPATVNVDELFQKTVTEDVDQRSIVEKQRIREYGAYASTKNGFTGWISLANLLKARTLPVFKEPVYPEVKLFKCSPDFMFKLSLVKEDKAQEKMEHEPIVDYERDGDFMQLFKCPLIASLDRRAKTDHHLRHDPRVFLMTQFIHFGEASRKKLHEILSSCTDYDSGLTQGYMDHAMQNGYHPETCARAKELRLGCPEDCKGSGGKSPIKFAWTPLLLEQLKDEYRKILLLPKEDEELIDVLLAVSLDPRTIEEPVWLFVVAPPSSGKTVLISSLFDPNHAMMIDSLTSKTFITGKTYTDSTTKQDKLIMGLLPKLNKKTLLVKEGTLILTKGKEERDAIFGQLRAIYDRYYGFAFGSIDESMIPEEWKHTRMGLIMGFTPFVDRYEMLQILLGERFLKIRLHEAKRMEAIAFSLNTLGDQEKGEKKLQQKVTRFLNNLTVPTDYKIISKEYMLRLAYLAEAIVKIRKPVTQSQSYMGTKMYEYEDSDELGCRLAKQLAKLGILLATVRNTPFDEAVWKTVERVAYDTLSPERSKLVKFFFTRKNATVSTSEIAKSLGWSEKRTRHHLETLSYISILITTDNYDFKLNDYIYDRMMHSRVEVGHTGLCAISYSYYNISSHTESRVHHEIDGKCDNFKLNSVCVHCAALKSCNKPALRCTLIHWVLKCSCHRCVRPAPYYPMTRWCRECLASGRYVYWGGA